jgi:hypothetical protein
MDKNTTDDILKKDVIVNNTMEYVKIIEVEYICTLYGLSP